MAEMQFPVGIPSVKMEEQARTVPDGEPPPLPINEKLKVIGKPTPRIDGKLKVTGAAKYTADINLPGMLHGKMLTSTITAGRVKSIDTSEAEKLPGVKAVYVLEKLLGGATPANEAANKYPLIRFAGQPIAAVAATTPNIARDAIKLIKVEYEPTAWVTDIEKARQPDAPLVFTAPAEQGATAGGGGGGGGGTQKGNVRTNRRNGPEQATMDKAFADSEVLIEHEFHTQVQTHSALETHGVVADYKPELLTVWASTQGTLTVRNEMADVMGLKREQIRVITDFMGGGFGAKFGAGNWGAMAANLSKKAGAPVKLMCDRKEEHYCTGNRPSSNQSIKLGAKKDGTLTAIQFSNYGTAGTGTGAGAGAMMRMYTCPNVVTEEQDVFTHAGPAAAFRAPGHPQSAFSIEQMIDALAEKIGMDPLALRDKIDNHEARRVERKVGAEKFGWANRKPAGSSEGPVKRGMGVAQGTWGRNSNRSAEAEVRITQDGSVTVLSSVQDIGSGIRTAMAQIVAEELGLKPTDITVKIGDTNYPTGVGSGGSVTTNSMAPVTRNAAYKAKLALFDVVGPELGVKPDDLQMADGKVSTKSAADKTLSFKQAAAKIKVEQVSGKATRGQDYANPQGSGAGGVQFAEVTVDTETGIVKVERVVAAQDCGRPVNPLTLTSQINGGIIQGTSYALFENRILDRQTGFMVNPNLEQYKIVGAKDTPKIDVIQVEQYWGRSSVDAGGIGEPANVPTAAAIANAVFNAIGVRITTIPMTPKVVLAAIAKAKAQTAQI